MRGVLVCPECKERMNVDLIREFTKVRCPCGRLLDREINLSGEEVIITRERIRI